MRLKLIKLRLFIVLVTVFSLSTSNVMAERARGYYTLDLISVDSDTQSFNENISMQLLPNGLPYAVCELDKIVIRWDLHLTHLYLNVENNTNSSIKVHWDESAFINTNNETLRIIHKGTKFSNKEKEQVPSIIIKGSKLSDVIIPADYANYSDYFKRWVFNVLFGSHKEGLNDGKIFKISLAIEDSGEVSNYVFTFELHFFKTKVQTHFTSDYLVEYEKIL